MTHHFYYLKKKQRVRKKDYSGNLVNISSISQKLGHKLKLYII